MNPSTLAHITPKERTQLERTLNGQIVTLQNDIRALQNRVANRSEHEHFAALTLQDDLREVDAMRKLADERERQAREKHDETIRRLDAAPDEIKRLDGKIAELRQRLTVLTSSDEIQKFLALQKKLEALRSDANVQRYLTLTGEAK